jgi:RHS repeat-associated protein
VCGQNLSFFTITAAYDNLNRLVEFTDPNEFYTWQTYQYRYDANGNRLQWGNDANYEGMTYAPPLRFGQDFLWQFTEYNQADQPTRRWTVDETGAQLQSTQIQFDANGNLKLERYTKASSSQQASTTYTYDAANRLTRYEYQSASGSTFRDNYTYDGDGRRTVWSNEAYGRYTTTAYEYVGYEIVSERIVADTTGQSGPGGGGDISVWYVMGPGGEKLYALNWSESNSLNLTANVYAMDHLGSVRQVVKANGDTANWHNYDPFGQITGQYRSLTTSYQFASAPLDAVYSSTTSGYSSFYNLRARLYNPGTGRFLTQDTVKGSPWIPWTQNLYTYVGNNPVNMIDPTGHVAEWLKNIVKANPCSNPLGLCKDIASAVLGFVPIVGDLKDWMEVIVGRDLITGARLTLGERVLTAAMGFVPFANGAAVRGGGKILMNSTEFAKKFDIHIGKSNYRENLAKLTGFDPKGYQAHHIFPQQFRSKFEGVFEAEGLSIDDPRLMVWWENKSHLSNAKQYNAAWDQFWTYHEGINIKPTVDQVLDYGKDLMKDYGFSIHAF